MTLVIPVFVQATGAESPVETGVVGCNIANNASDLGSVISYYVCLVSRYTTVFAVLIIIAVGIMYIIGGFNPGTAATAKTILVTTITGLIFMYLITYILNVLIFSKIMSVTAT